MLLIGTFAIVIYPNFAAIIIPGYLGPMFIYEVTLGFWLLFKGVNLQKPDGTTGTVAA